MKKVAILDTDFISKGHIVRANESNHLVDCVLKLQGYDFFCHEQTSVELGRHNASASSWLDVQIREGLLIEYSDERIIQEMRTLYYQAALSQYTLILKNACDAFDKQYFTEHYRRLEEIDQLHTSQEEYILTLKGLDEEIGQGSNLGEIKEYVLLQWLNIRSEAPVFYFCSDDKNARNGILSVEAANVQCVSVVSAFHWLKSDGVFTKETAQPYIDSALHYYKTTKQATVRVIEASPVGRFVRIPYQQAFEDIFEGRFVRLSNGMLKYRPDTEP